MWYSDTGRYGMSQRKSAGAVVAALLAVVLAAALGGCATTSAVKCSGPGQIVWDRGRDPERDAPRWTDNPKAAAREARVSRFDIPDKYILYTGVSEDKNDERGARFSAVEDMLKRYAVYLQRELDRILPEAAEEAGVALPDINTALGADLAMSYLPREPVESDIIRSSWTATGTLCPVESGEPVYRTYVLGVFDRDVRRAHLLEAAKETLKYAIIRAEHKELILREAEKLVKRL
jgi:hypothetical protein